MIRFVLRFVAFFVLAAACVLGVGDAARSLAASDWRLMDLAEAATLAAPHMPDGLPTPSGTGADILAWLWAHTAHLPAAPTLAVLALFLFGATARPVATRRRTALRH